MKEFLKSIFTYDILINSFFGTVGYTLGFLIPNKQGCGIVASIISSIIFGSIFDSMAYKILENKKITSSKRNKFLLFVLVYTIYYAVWTILDKLFHYDLDNELISNICYLVLIQIIAFIINAIKVSIKEKKKNKI